MGRTLNLGILAHVDAGKTSLTERLLFANNAISQLGSVDAGSTQTDSSDLERERGITIRSSVASFVTRDLQVNIVDTPGHPDFIAEVERALSVLDSAIVVVSAVEGVQAQTRVLMRSLRKLKLPTLIFINKIDRMGAREAALLADIRTKIVPHVVPMNTVRELGSAAASTVPIVEDRFVTQTAEILADNDDSLLARLVEGSMPTRSELLPLVVAQTATGELHPVFFGSALTGEGVEELTDGVRTLLSPATQPTDPDAPARGTVFAIERGGRGEKVAYLRLFSGELRERQRIRLRRREPGGSIVEYGGRIAKLDVVGASFHPSGSADDAIPGRVEPGRRLTAGQVGRIRGLPQIRVGDQLGQAVEPGGEGHFPPPSLETVVRPTQPGQEARLHAALTSLADEDPLIRTRTSADGATSVLLYGAVQQEVIAARLRREYGVESVFERLKPVYFERPVGTGASLWEFERHAASTVFFTDIGLRVEPGEIGSGVTFVRQVEWGALPRAFHRAIEEATFAALEQGLYGWEVIDCRITLFRVGYQSPATTAGQFRSVTPIVVMRALEAAGTRVYEPCHSLEVEVPAEALGGVLGFLASLGADIMRSVEKRGSWLIAAELPARLMQQLATALPGLTHGEGALWSRPGGARPVRGPVPTRERSDGNPLNYEEYMRFLSNRGLASSATASTGHAATR